MLHPVLIFAIAVICIISGMVIENTMAKRQKPEPEKKYKPRTVGWYLDQLPSPHREICLFYMNEAYADDYVISASKAVSIACIWEQTPYPSYFADLFHCLEKDTAWPMPPDDWIK